MKVKQTKLTYMQLVSLIILRIAVGWHFFYEGIIKLLSPNWSSLGYLLDAKGFFAPLFHTMAQHSKLLSTIDFLNEWGLVLIGVSLMLGWFTRISAYSAMAMLMLYYLSHPSFIGLNYALPSEGNYLIVDKVLIEFLAAWVIALIPTGRYLGIDRLWRNRAFKRKKIKLQN